MADHPNADRIRKGYQAFAAGDMETLSELFAADLVWHVGGQNRLTGEYKGQEEVFGFFGKLMEMTAGDMTMEVHDVLANDEHGVALLRTRVSAGGKSMDQNEVHVFHLKDGKVGEFWGFEWDQRLGDEVFS